MPEGHGGSTSRGEFKLLDKDKCTVQELNLSYYGYEPYA
jgi:hypothetical protein